MSSNGIAPKALYLCRDKSGLKREGKWMNRPKALRPQNLEAIRRAERCHKKPFSNIDLAKRAVRSANYAREMAEKTSGNSRRCEVRYYICENCGIGSGKKIWHLTSLSESEYATKFEESAKQGARIAA